MSKDTTTIPVHDILPIRIIRDNYIISEDGCITVGYLLSLPVWGEITKEDYSSFVDSFKKALRNLPDWTLVHRQDIFLKARVPVVGLAKDLRDKDSFLSEKHREHFKEREYMTHFQRIFFTHNPNNPSRKSLMRGKFLQSGIGKARVTIIPQQEKINEFCSITRDFMNSVFSYRNSILFRELCREDYVGLDNSSGLLESYLSLSDCESSKSISMLSDLYCEDGDSISIGKKHMIGFNLSCASDFPSEISDCTPYHRMKCSLGESVVLGYSHPISLCMDCEHILNTYIIKADQQSIKRDLEAKYRRMHSMSSETYNEINGKQIRKYLKRLESEDLLSVYHRTGILAWGQGKGSENAVEHAVRNALSSMNICARRISKVLPEEYIYGIPGCEMDFSENDYMLEEVSASSCLLPWETFDKGLPDGSLSLVERISARPINLDLSVEAFSKGWINAYNAFVLGPTGSGKSFFMNHFLRCCHDRGARICILDNGKSYVGLDALVKQEKTKNESSRTRKKANAALAQTISNFNPFAGFIGEGKWLISESRLDLENPSVQFFLGLVKTICSLPEGWTASKDSILNEFLKVFCIGYKGTEDPCFNDFYDYLVSIKYKEDGKETGAEQLDGDLLKEIIITLEAYSEGGNYSEILNGKGSEDLLSGDFSLFEIGEIMDSHSKTYSSLCLFCIIRSFDRMMRQDVDSFKILVIEEAWKALSNKEMEPYLNSLWKTSRKYNTAAIVVTQQMSDIISSDIIKDTIIANSPIKIILDQRECISELDSTAETLGLTETDKRLIRSLNTDKGNNPAKEVFLKIGQGKSGAYKVEVSPSEALLFESSLKEKTELLSVIEKGTSIESFVKKNAKRILKTKA